MRVTERMKKWISMILCLCMLAQNAPMMVFAASTDNLCDHHPKHTEDCGYVEAVAGFACTHKHSEACYEIVDCKHTCSDECDDPCTTHTCTVDDGCITMERDCHHIHGECGYAEAVEPQDCTTCQPVLVHAQNCGYVESADEVTCACEPTVTHGGEGCTYVEGKDGSPCTHVCAVVVDSDDSCYKLLCSHKDGGHDNACGYAAAVEGHACHYAGAECAQCEELQECGCPVNAEQHLETCLATADASGELPLFVNINENKFSERFNVAKGEVGPSMKFALSENGAYVTDPITSFTYDTTKILLTQREAGSEYYNITGMDGTGENGTMLTYHDGNGNAYSIKVVVEGWSLVATLQGSQNTEPQLNLNVGASPLVTFKLGNGKGFRPITGGTFESSNSAILVVNDYGDTYDVCGLTAVAEGTADVIYKLNGVEFHMTVTVETRLMIQDGPNLISEVIMDEGTYKTTQFYLGQEQIPYENLEVSGDAITITEDENGRCKLTAIHPGNASVTYTVDGKTYSCSVTVVEKFLLMKFGSQYFREVTLSTGDFRLGQFYLAGELIPLANLEVSGDAITITEDADGQYKLTAVKEGTTSMSYTVGGKTYSCSVRVGEIYLSAKDDSGWIGDLRLTTGDEKLVQFYLEREPVSFANLRVTSDALTLTEAANGQCKLTANHAGFFEIIGTVDCREYRFHGKVVDSVDAEGYLYYVESSDMFGTYPVTCVDIPVGSERREYFYFGDIPLRIEADGTKNFTWSGAIEVVRMDSDGGLIIQADDEPGTGYLEYRTTDASGKTVLNCFVFNVLDPNQPAPSGTYNGTYMWYGDTAIGFGGEGLRGFPEGRMILYHEVTGSFDDVTVEPFEHRAMVAAIKSNGEPNADMLKNVIKNVKFTVLSAVYPKGTPAEQYRLHLSQEEATWVQITDTLGAYANTYVAGAGIEFDGKAGVTFDLDEGEVLRRISLLTSTYVQFFGNEVRVVASDIDSAAKLNAILYSREALLNWIQDKHDSGRTEEGDQGLPYADTVAEIFIQLPAADLSDAVVVCQAIGAMPYIENPISTPDFRIILRGADNGGTKMAGLISKGSVFGVNMVIFEADPDVTMTREGVNGEFTCGIMADPFWNGEVQYDTTYFNKYAKGTKQYFLSDWGGNELKDMHCDVTGVNGCVFDGFDYGTYSNDDGFVAGGHYNTFQNCYYGIYIDSAAKSGWEYKKSNSDYSQYTFHKNVYAVRVKGLQHSISPYDFRIHDSDFINNHIEFAIEDYTDEFLQYYYFYRNHYRGAWNGHGNVGWVKNTQAPPEATANNEAHRAPNYQILDKNGEVTTNGGRIKISGTPGKANANMANNASNARSVSEGYWIYDGDDQVTRIMANETLPIAEESLTALTKDTDVSLVTNDGTSTIAVWTFEGGE